MHSHGHHHHAHSSRTALLWSLVATLGFVAVQAGAGLWSGSLALLSDAGHNFADALALVLALIGLWLQSRPADESRTYGYGRAGVLAAFVNALALVALSLYLFFEAIQRLRSPNPVDEQTMIGVAAAGIVVNLGIMWALHRHSYDMNIRAASLHMLSDALGSVAIVVGAIAIRYTGWLVIDPVLSIGIGVLIVLSASGIMRESLNVLLEGMPQGMKLDAVRQTIASVPGVLDVHDLHVWSLGASAHALSCHALIEDLPPSESNRILRNLQCAVADRHGIHRTTVQFEHAGCSLTHGCSMQPADGHRHTHSHSH